MTTRFACAIFALLCCVAAAGCTSTEYIQGPDRGPRTGDTLSAGPRLLDFPHGVLPASARAERAAGTVHVLARIEADGRVRRAAVAISVPGLDSAAVEAVRASRWSPARCKGRPIALWWDVPTFGCEGGPAYREFLYYEEAPVRISMPMARYPPAAREARIQGTVKVQALVGVDGSVWCTRMAKSIPALDDAAREAVRASNWRPARNGGGPVAVWVEIPVSFRLG